MTIGWTKAIAETLCGLSVCFLLSGCWDRTEVNDLATVMAAGIDQTDHGTIEFSVQVFIPKQTGGGQGLEGGGGGTGGSQTIVRSAEGKTLAEAVSKLQEKLPRRIFWGHDEIFIFSQAMAKKGVREHIDYLDRFPPVRERAILLVSRREAKEVLEVLPPLERSSSEVMRKMITSRTGIMVTLKDFSQMLKGDSGAATMPWVELVAPKNGGDEQLKKIAPYIVGSAVFRKDKLVGHIDDRVTRGVLWFRNEIKTAVVTADPPEAGGLVSMNLIRSQSRLIPSIKNGKWEMTIKADTEDDVVQNTGHIDVNNPTIADMLEGELRKGIEDYMKMAVRQAQKNLKADILGFADAFHRKYPKEWNKQKDRWPEIFPTVAIHYEITAHIRRTGAANFRLVK